MKVIPQNTNINFTGYKNLLSHGEFKGDNSLYYMAMTLYDDEENKDLTTFREIKKMLSLDTKDEDIITFTYTKYGNRNEALFIDTSFVASEKDLANYSKTMKKETFNYYERMTMKIYSLLASLTKRIQNDENIKTEVNGLEKVLNKFTRVIILMSKGDVKLAYDFIESTVFSKTNHKNVANVLHKKITDKMTHYFA